MHYLSSIHVYQYPLPLPGKKKSCTDFGVYILEERTSLPYFGVYILLLPYITPRQSSINTYSKWCGGITVPPHTFHCGLQQ
jgi:hypothetical protein